MVNSLYSFVDVEAKNPPPQTIANAIRSVLRANDGACYADMEAYLIAPGVSGSKFFDQAYAVDVLLKHDRESDGQIAKLMSKTPTLKRRNLWDALQKVLRTTGFKMRHGRLAGLLEVQPDPETETNEDGQPDID